MNIAIVAGGTGGHIFPALAVAKALEQRGHRIVWVGAIGGMETKIVPQYDIELETIQIQNLRGKGLLRYALMPFRLLRAILQTRSIFKKHKIDLALGFGGFVAGPGGLAARSLKIPLIIHEQNAVAGMTNRHLAKFARYILTGFPSVFEDYVNKVVTGNPVRADLLPLRDMTYKAHYPLHILVIGGSLGAQIFNEVIPQTLKNLGKDVKLDVWHQTGAKHFEETQAHFEALGVQAKVTAFIDNMNEAYAWADLIICRAGALTVAELSLIGKPAIFVPFPQAVDDHQTKNAMEANQSGAAILLYQSDFNAENLGDLLRDFVRHPDRLEDMAAKMKALGKVDATAQIVKICEGL